MAMIYVTGAELDSIKERLVGSKKKQCAFVFYVDWSDGSSCDIWRSYNDFFEFQCRLLDSFPEEAGSVRGFARIIPYLPGRKIFRKSDLALAEERKSDIESYVKTLIKLPSKISQSSVFVSFFQRRGTDPERFHQFPQRINRLSRDEETCNSFTDVSSDQEGKNTPRINDCLNINPAKEDYAQVSYTNLTFEASGSMERERPLKS